MALIYGNFTSLLGINQTVPIKDVNLEKEIYIEYVIYNCFV